MSKKVVGMHFVEHAEIMLFIVWEPHGDLPARVQKPFFSRARCEGAPEASGEGFGRTFLDFGVFGGSLGYPISGKNRAFLQV